MAKRIPDAIAEKVLKACERNEAVVVVARNGKPSRVFSLEKYLKMKEQPAKHKPWNHRKSRGETPDPLGAAHLNLKVLMPITRKTMYEMDDD